MIAKGKIRGEGVKLAAYLLKGEDGERAELLDMRGFGLQAKDLIEGFRQEEEHALATKAEKPFFHAHFRSVEGEGKQLTRQQWLEIADGCDTALGRFMTQQPRGASLHIDRKTGDVHMHLAYSLVAQRDDGRAFVHKLGLYETKLQLYAREIEQKYGLQIVSNERRAGARRGNQREHEESRRLGTDIHAIRSAILDSFEKSDSGKAFNSAIRTQGGIVANGDRGFVVIDPAGGHHALNKKLTGKTLAEIGQRLSDLDRSQLPTVDQAKAIQRDRQTAREAHQTRDHGRDGIAPPSGPTPSHGPENGRGGASKPFPELGKTAGEIRLAWRLTGSGQQFAKEIENRRLELVYVSRAQADASHRLHVFAKSINRQRRELREGFGVVDQRGNVTRIDQRVTGDQWEEIQKRLGGIDKGELLTVDQARDLMQHRNREEFREQKQAERDAARAPTPIEEKILDAAKPAAGDHQKFADELRKEGIGLAVVTAADVKAIDELRRDEHFAAAADPTYQPKFFPQLEEGQLAAVDKFGGIHQLNPHHMAELVNEGPSVLELRTGFEIERGTAARFQQTMIDIQLQRRDDAAAERVTAFQERAADREVSRTVGSAERGIDQGFSNAETVINTVADVAAGAMEGIGKMTEAVFSFLSPAPSLTRDQAELAGRAADEKNQQAADLSAYRQNEAARDEQIARRDEEQSQNLTAREYFRPIIRHGPGVERDDDRERERER